MGNNTYSYYCKCDSFDDDYILRKECSRWIADVETSNAKHTNEFKPGVHATRWKMNNKKNHNKT